MTSIKDKLKASRRPEKVVTLCLRGDLVGDFDAVRREHDALEEAGPNASLNAGAKRRELLGRMEAIRDEMRESATDFRLQALPRTRWTELVVKYPPRDGLLRDRAMGVNEDEFIAALLRACVVDPVLDEEDWAVLEETLTNSQYLELGNAAWELNQEKVSVPFLPAASPSQGTSGSG